MKTKFLLIALSFVLLSCESLDVNGIGIIQGKLTIGPLCGNIPSDTEPNMDNPCGLSDAELNAIYGEYKVIVSSSTTNTKTLTKEKVLDKTGKFTFEIPSGDYKVQVLKKDGTEIFSNSEKNQVSKNIILSENQVVEVNLVVEMSIK